MTAYASVLKSMGGPDHNSMRGRNGTSLKCCACKGVIVCWSKEGNEGPCKVRPPGPRSSTCQCFPFDVSPPVREDPAFSCREQTFQEDMKSLFFANIKELKRTVLIAVYGVYGLPIVSAGGTPPLGFDHGNHKPGHNNGKENTLYFKLPLGGWFCVHARVCPETKKLQIVHIPKSPLSIYCCGPPAWAKEDPPVRAKEDPPVRAEEDDTPQQAAHLPLFPEWDAEDGTPQATTLQARGNADAEESPHAPSPDAQGDVGYDPQAANGWVGGTSHTEEPPHSPSPDAQEGSFDDIFSHSELLQGLSPGSHAKEPSQASLKAQEDAEEGPPLKCQVCCQGYANCELKCNCKGSADKRYCEACLHNLCNTRYRYPMPASPAIQINLEEMMTCAFCQTETFMFRILNAEGVPICDWQRLPLPYGWIYLTPFFNKWSFDRSAKQYKQTVEDTVNRIEALKAHLDVNEEDKGSFKHALDDLQRKQKVTELTTAENQQLDKLPGQIELQCGKIKQNNHWIATLEKRLPHWVQDTTGNVSYSQLPQDQGTPVSFLSIDEWLTAESNRIQRRGATRSSWAQEELVHIPEALYLPSDFSSSDTEDEGDDSSTFHPARNRLLVDLTQFDSDEDDEEAGPASAYPNGPSRNTRSAARFQLQPRSNIRN